MRERYYQLLDDWLQSCTRGGKLSRNTICVGIVVFDHLRNKSPLLPEEVISPGGEIIGARSRLHSILRLYGIAQPEKYLKEVTTRQAHPDGRKLFEAFDYGKIFSGISDAERASLLVDLIRVLTAEIEKWFDRQAIKIAFERYHSPVEWVRKVLEAAKSKSGGVVEQHFVGAVLQQRHPNIDIPNFPGHAADVQTGRPGDFLIGETVYHVTAAPGSNVVQKCGENVKSGLHPVLLVPGDLVSKTKSFAEYVGLEKHLAVIAIEDFAAVNIIEMAIDEHIIPFEILRRIISIYNNRLEVVETDMSLKIEIQ